MVNFTCNFFRGLKCKLGYLNTLQLFRLNKSCFIIYVLLQHSVHPVHLTLQASSTPVVDRGIRQVTPDRLTRDQAATFRPSDLPIGQGHRRWSMFRINTLVAIAWHCPKDIYLCLHWANNYTCRLSPCK